jgi:deoxycytidylate deaminase
MLNDNLEKVSGKKLDKLERITDTETKLLSQIDNQLTKLISANKKAEDITGTIELFTKYEPCENCFGLISQFREKYPNVNLVIKYKYDYSIKRP